MSSPPVAGPRQSRLSTALAQNRIGAFGITLSIGSSVAPLTVCALVIPTAMAVTGQPGIAIGVALVGVLLLLFSVGYLAMAQRITNAGAFYAYAAQAISKPVAVAVALVALVAYNCFAIASAGGVGTIAAPLVSDWLGMTVTWWTLALLGWLVVAVLGLFEIGVSEKVLGVLVIPETLLVLGYSVAIMSADGFRWTFHPLALGNLSWGSLGVIAALAFTCFAGLEQAAAYAEEARDARRNVAVALRAAILLAMGIYTFAAVVIYSAAGSDVYTRAGEEGPTFFANLASPVLGGWVVNFGMVLLGTSLIAAWIAFHNLISRYGFALGRELVLPAVFGRAHGGAPRYASMAQSGLGLLVIVLYAVAGWDPLVKLFFWGATAGGVGVLLLVTVTSIAVIAYFRRNTHTETVWTRLIAPLLASLCLLYLVWATADNLPGLFGVNGWTGPAVLVPGIYLLVAVIGVIWGLSLRTQRPDVYRGIGLGAKSTVTSIAGTAPQDRTNVGVPR